MEIWTRWPLIFFCVCTRRTGTIPNWMQSLEIKCNIHRSSVWLTVHYIVSSGRKFVSDLGCTVQCTEVGWKVVLRNTLHGTYDITAFVSDFITSRCTQLAVSVPELSLCVISVEYGFYYFTVHTARSQRSWTFVVCYKCRIWIWHSEDLHRDIQLEVSVPELSLCVISVEYGFDIQRTCIMIYS